MKTWGDIHKESFMQVYTGNYVYEMTVGYNIQNPLYWNPEHFDLNLRKVTDISTDNFFVRFKLDNGTDSFTMQNQKNTTYQEARIFNRIYFGHVLESKIIYIDAGGSSRFYICDRDFLEEVLRNMREDFIRAQKLQMRKMKQNMKQFNCDFRDAMKLL